MKNISCLKFNDRINTHENKSCPRGEIGRHKGLKKHRVEIFYSLTQSHTVLNPIKSYTLKKPLIIFIGKYE